MAGRVNACVRLRSARRAECVRVPFVVLYRKGGAGIGRFKRAGATFGRRTVEAFAGSRTRRMTNAPSKIAVAMPGRGFHP
jgi:hypothetical protein